MPKMSTFGWGDATFPSGDRMVLVDARLTLSGLRRCLAGGALALCLGLHAGPGGAQTLEVSGACAQQCGATSRHVREHRGEIQACLIRCNATQQFESAAAPPPAPPRIRHAEAHRSAATRQATTDAASGRRTPPVTQGRAPAHGATAMPASAAASAHPRGLPYASDPPAAARAPAEPAARPGQIALAAATGSGLAMAPASLRWGAAYLAAAPATEFGLVVGAADRLAAHAQAQGVCGERGAPCRPALEFTERCGAVAQARRTLGLFRTSDPRTYSDSYAAAGSGNSQQAAEANAMDQCRARERTISCEIVASQCGRP